MLKRKLTQTLAKAGVHHLSLLLVQCFVVWAWLKLKKPHIYFSMDGINKVIFEEAVKSSLLNNLNKHHL